MRTQSTILSILICVSCTASRPYEDPVRDDLLNVTFPARIGTLDLKSREQYEQPELGYSLRYDDGDLFKADVYVYDKKLSDIGDGTDSKRVKQEFESVVGVFSMMEKLGKYKDVRQLGRGTTSYPKGNLQFLWSRCQYRQTPEEGVTYQGLRVSETYLSARAGKFVKVRITLKEQDFKKKQVEVIDFMKQLASILGTSQDASVPSR